MDGLPLVFSIMCRMRMRQILSEYIPTSKRSAIPDVDTLLLLVINLAVARDPLYELQQWVESLDLRCLGYEEKPYANSATIDSAVRLINYIRPIDPP